MSTFDSGTYDGGTFDKAMATSSASPQSLSVMTAPHFSIPFRIDPSTNECICNEQDSEAEILDCIEVILRYQIGKRPEKPEFGIPDQTFSEPVPDVGEISEALAEWEPRIDMVINPAQIDKLDPLISKIKVEKGRG